MTASNSNNTAIQLVQSSTTTQLSSTTGGEKEAIAAWILRWWLLQCQQTIAKNVQNNDKPDRDMSLDSPVVIKVSWSTQKDNVITVTMVRPGPQPPVLAMSLMDVMKASSKFWNS
jgi:hypothetical protein